MKINLRKLGESMESELETLIKSIGFDKSIATTILPEFSFKKETSKNLLGEQDLLS